MGKEAKTTYHISSELSNRWSPRAFENKPIEKEKIQRLMEAARWSPSASNEQPWYFIVGEKGTDTYHKIHESLVEFNQMWASNAPLLILNIGKSVNSKGDKNSVYRYDVGQSVAHLTFQAIKDDLYVHQMTGFDPKKAEGLFEIPENYHAISVMAIGYLGDASMLHERMQKAEMAERVRKPLNEFVFEGKFGQKSDIIE